MTKDECQKVVQAIAMLDQFAENTEKKRPWHTQWELAYQQVIQQIATLVVDESFIDAEVKDAKP